MQQSLQFPPPPAFNVHTLSDTQLYQVQWFGDACHFLVGKQSKEDKRGIAKFCSCAVPAIFPGAMPSGSWDISIFRIVSWSEAAKIVHGRPDKPTTDGQARDKQPHRHDGGTTPIIFFGPLSCILPSPIAQPPSSPPPLPHPPPSIIGNAGSIHSNPIATTVPPPWRPEKENTNVHHL